MATAPVMEGCLAPLLLPILSPPLPPHSHRPDSVHGGGAHRYSAISSRVSTETNAPIRGGFEQIQVTTFLLLEFVLVK